jgi:hypothetical protein
MLSKLAKRKERYCGFSSNEVYPSKRDRGSLIVK